MSYMTTALKPINAFGKTIASTFNERGTMAALKYSLLGYPSFAKVATIGGSAAVGGAIGYQDSGGRIGSTLSGAARYGALGLAGVGAFRAGATIMGAGKAVAAERVASGMRNAISTPRQRMNPASFRDAVMQNRSASAQANALMPTSSRTLADRHADLLKEKAQARATRRAGRVPSQSSGPIPLGTIGD